MDWRILLSHHAPGERDRCVHIPGLPPLCRRCLALYPAAGAVMVAQLATGLIPEPIQLPILALAPLPTTAVFVAEQLGWIAYARWMVVAGSLLLALALGIGLARYLLNPADRLFWGMVLLYGAPAACAVVWRKLDAAPADTSELPP